MSANALRCPNCGAPPHPAAETEAGAFVCAFCGTRVEREDAAARALREARERERLLEQEIAAKDREAERLRMAARSERAARVRKASAGGCGSLVATLLVGGAVAHFVARSTSKVTNDVLRQIQSATAPLVPAIPTLPTLPAPSRAPIERGPLVLHWRGKITSSTGAAPAAGAPCTLTATATTSAAGSLAITPVTFQCGGAVLYDSTDALNGESMTSGDLTEGVVAGEVSTFAYAVSWNDTGSRTGKRSQISLSTRDGEVHVFRDTVPLFRVQAAIEEYSTPPRRGKPINAGHVPPFDHLVTRTATVTATSGKVPFKGKACDLKVSPANTEGETCAVLLTCAGKVVFGMDGTGFEACTIKAGEPVGFTDAYPTPKDGDPEFHLDLTANAATLGDTLTDGTTYAVTFALK